MTIHTVLLVSGAIAGPLFVIAFMAQSTTRSEYDWVRQPVSALALGRFGWMQKTNFVITGLLMLALATGLYTAVRPAGIAIAASLLIGVSAIGLIGAGVFVTDPVGDYRPDTLAQSSPNVHGALHGGFSMAVFIALPAACFVLTWGFAITASPDRAIYSGFTGAFFIAGFCTHIDRIRGGDGALASQPAGQRRWAVPAPDDHPRMGLAFVGGDSLAHDRMSSPPRHQSRSRRTPE